MSSLQKQGVDVSVMLQTTQEEMKHALPAQRKIPTGQIDVSVNQI